MHYEFVVSLPEEREDTKALLRAASTETGITYSFSDEEGYFHFYPQHVIGKLIQELKKQTESRTSEKMLDLLINLEYAEAAILVIHYQPRTTVTISTYLEIQTASETWSKIEKAYMRIIGVRRDLSAVLKPVQIH